MSTTRHRLRLIEGNLARRSVPPASATPFDAGRLTPAERRELDDHRRATDRLPRRPNGRPDLGGLTDAQLDRGLALLRKAHGIPPDPPHAFMRHRPADIGECWCRGRGTCAQPEPTS